ncbi:disintegrin and metalloproteinase domain-containing protein 15 isoform X1 [Clupea harengus]|uniref:Disintegrin and metalloproteinase domain-containing protein 15 isoform X1 n=1 Tax=Clupea harengus TaxID=7950 RepID=A0A6P8G6H7_CLUHA|nr:disintegrin and metalloproteinase domain-containing protein 15 isoform X1 [Clupea harengus]
MSLSACAVVLPLRVLLTVLLLQGSPCGFLKGALSMTVLLPAQSRLELFNDTEALQPVHVEIPDTSTSIFTESKEETLSQRNTSSATSHALHSDNDDHHHGRKGKPLERTKPFAIVNGHRKSLTEALQNGHPERLQCGLEVGNRIYMLDLEKNQNLLPKPPNVFYYLPNGTGVAMEQSPVTHCYYHGSVQGFPQSRVALSTCAGLRGVIVINSTLSFELQPEEDGEWDESEEQSGGLEEEGMHLLYPAHQRGPSAGGCGVSHTPVPPLYAPPQVHRHKRDILSETKYIELVLVADHKEFLNYQKNNKTIIYRMLDVANQVDWFYRPLNVRVALLGLEIWSDQDRIQVDKSPTETLNRFLEWRTRELLPRLRHDNAQLIMGDSFDGTTVGMASQSSMCSKDRSGGVNVDHLVSVLGVASTVAHELGHNLGMTHDTAERRCQCQNEPRMGGCIMEPSTGLMPGQLFSSCSARDLSLSLLHGGGMCLFNVPQPEMLLGGPRCGNLYVEKGEECDCGLLDECNDPCCNASTCKLMPGAQCSSDGICCENCKLRTAGWVCRQPLGECDLPEHCTGNSPFCPPNVFLQNGEPCEGTTSSCYSGVCASLNAQCQMLWGPNATRAPPVCFSSVNKQGSKYGNCGQMANGSYIPCPSADVLCGRIQCKGGSDRPLLGSNAEILTTKVRLNHSDFTCRGTFFDLGDDVSDPAMVTQGTSCGQGKACVDQRCQDVSVFGVEECKRKCHGHGVCNSNKNCHCDTGWAPPDCKYSGSGGSVDSGPARQPKDSDLVQVALLVFFLLVLPASLMLWCIALHIPRCRRKLSCLGISPLQKGESHQQSRVCSVAHIKMYLEEPSSKYRTRAGERSDDHKGEEVQPLRNQSKQQNDIPLTSTNKVQERPAPPNKPLPPDPVVKTNQSARKRPTPPNKPLPPDPPLSQGKTQRKRPAPPDKPLPPDPVQANSQNPAPPKPPVPKKPLPVNPPSFPAGAPGHPPGLATGGASIAPSTHGLRVPSAGVVPTRHPPLPPTRAPQPRKPYFLASPV